MVRDQGEALSKSNLGGIDLPTAYKESVLKSME